jgi:hypothetical protein
MQLLMKNASLGQQGSPTDFRAGTFSRSYRGHNPIPLISIKGAFRRFMKTASVLSETRRLFPSFQIDTFTLLPLGAPTGSDAETCGDPNRSMGNRGPSDRGSRRLTGEMDIRIKLI